MFALTCGVYQLIGKTGFYIGCSCRIEIRASQHLCDLNAGRHCNPKLQADFDRHGPLTVRTLLICSMENLIMFEQLCIDGFSPSLNRSRIAMRVEWTDEMRAAAGEKSRGRRWKLTPEQRSRMSLAQTGKKMSDEARRKMSIAKRQMSPETKAKISAAKRNLSAETIAKMSAAQLGKKLSPETIKKRTASWKANTQRRNRWHNQTAIKENTNETGSQPQ